MCTIIITHEFPIRYWIAGCLEAESGGLQFYPVRRKKKLHICQMFIRWTAGPTRILTPIAVSCVLIFWLNRVKTLQVALEELPLKLTLLTPRSPSLLETAKLSCFSQRHCRERLSQKAWPMETDASVWSWNSLANILCRWQVSHFLSLVQVEAAGFVGSERQLEAICSPQSSCSDCAHNLSFSLLKSNDDDQIHVTLTSYLSTVCMTKFYRGYTWWVTDWR